MHVRFCSSCVSRKSCGNCQPVPDVVVDVLLGFVVDVCDEAFISSADPGDRFEGHDELMTRDHDSTTETIMYCVFLVQTTSYGNVTQ